MEKEMDVANRAIREAGYYLAQAFQTEHIPVQEKKSGGFVTECDFASHTILEERILDAFPDHQIFSEESENISSLEITNEPTWVIDPLDGTSNFVSHLPLFSVMLCYLEQKQPKFSFIYDPIHHELFRAVKGGGAFLNNKPIHVSQKSKTKGAFLLAGRGYKHKDRQRHGKIIYTLEQQTPCFRRLGSASTMLCAVAAGRAESVILTGSQPWDTLAGSLLIEEAGGKITDYLGNPWNYLCEDMVATNGHIHNELLHITGVQAYE